MTSQKTENKKSYVCTTKQINIIHGSLYGRPGTDADRKAAYQDRVSFCANGQAAGTAYGARAQVTTCFFIAGTSGTYELEWRCIGNFENSRAMIDNVRIIRANEHENLEK